MGFPIKLDTSIKGRIADMNRAVDAGAYISALAIALTIPDVCSNIALPDEKGPERYATWFDKYVAIAYLNPLVTNGETGSSASYYFSGKDCYDLRCVFLHEGTHAPHPNQSRQNYSAIQFRLFEGDDGGDHIGCTYASDDEGNSEKYFRQVDLNMLKFFKTLTDGTKSFLDEFQGNVRLAEPDTLLYQPVVDFRETRWHS